LVFCYDCYVTTADWIYRLGTWFSFTHICRSHVCYFTTDHVTTIYVWIIRFVYALPFWVRFRRPVIITFRCAIFSSPVVPYLLLLIFVTVALPVGVYRSCHCRYTCRFRVTVTHVRYCYTPRLYYCVVTTLHAPPRVRCLHGRSFHSAVPVSTPTFTCYRVRFPVCCCYLRIWIYVYDLHDYTVRSIHSPLILRYVTFHLPRSALLPFLFDHHTFFCVTLPLLPILPLPVWLYSTYPFHPLRSQFSFRALPLPVSTEHRSLLLFLFFRYTPCSVHFHTRSTTLHSFWLRCTVYHVLPTITITVQLRFRSYRFTITLPFRPTLFYVLPDPPVCSLLPTVTVHCPISPALQTHILFTTVRWIFVVVTCVLILFGLITDRCSLGWYRFVIQYTRTTTDSLIRYLDYTVFDYTTYHLPHYTDPPFYTYYVFHVTILDTIRCCFYRGVVSYSLRYWLFDSLLLLRTICILHCWHFYTRSDSPHGIRFPFDVHCYVVRRCCCCCYRFVYRLPPTFILFLFCYLLLFTFCSWVIPFCYIPTGLCIDLISAIYSIPDHCSILGIITITFVGIYLLFDAGGIPLPRLLHSDTLHYVDYHYRDLYTFPPTMFWFILVVTAIHLSFILFYGDSSTTSRFIHFAFNFWPVSHNIPILPLRCDSFVVVDTHHCFYHTFARAFLIPPTAHTGDWPTIYLCLPYRFRLRCVAYRYTLPLHLRFYLENRYRTLFWTPSISLPLRYRLHSPCYTTVIRCVSFTPPFLRSTVWFRYICGFRYVPVPLLLPLPQYAFLFRSHRFPPPVVRLPFCSVLPLPDFRISLFYYLLPRSVHRCTLRSRSRFVTPFTQFLTFCVVTFSHSPFLYLYGAFHSTILRYCSHLIPFLFHYHVVRFCSSTCRSHLVASPFILTRCSQTNLHSACTTDFCHRYRCSCYSTVVTRFYTALPTTWIPLNWVPAWYLTTFTWYI